MTSSFRILHQINTIYSAGLPAKINTKHYHLEKWQINLKRLQSLEQKVIDYALENL